MNTTRRALALASLALTLLAGCNWSQLIAFRAQMGAIAEFTAWEGTTEEVFVFRRPLLTLRDLNEFNVYPEVIDARNAVLRYQRVGAPPGVSTGYEIRLQFVDA